MGAGDGWQARNAALVAMLGGPLWLLASVLLFLTPAGHALVLWIFTSAESSASLTSHVWGLSWISVSLVLPTAIQLASGGCFMVRASQGSLLFAHGWAAWYAICAGPAAPAHFPWHCCLLLGAMAHLATKSGRADRPRMQGMGKQSAAMWINVGGQFCCAAPLALLLAFKFGWGVEGIAAGLALGTVVQACSYLVILLDLDWGHAAAQISAYQRAKALEHKAAAAGGA